MQVHYFQRYHSKENVATANTMLLLSRLYSYSTNKFFALLKSVLFSDSADFEPETSFILQKKRGNAVPDAEFGQPSFKVVVETKLDQNSFDTNQLMRHLKAFEGETYKVLMTLAPAPMPEDKKKEFENQLTTYNMTAFNTAKDSPVRHINMTFEHLEAEIRDVIEDRDYEMQEVLDDYRDYCIADKLIEHADAWKYMRMQLAGETIAFNVQKNVYYDNETRRFRPHTYLGLYKKKSVLAIGKICAMIVIEPTSQGIIYKSELGKLTAERKELIQEAIEDGKTHGYDLLAQKQRFFFVEKFYETDFKKTTPGPSMGTRIFDLSTILGTDNLPDTETIAELLKEKTWN